MEHTNDKITDFKLYTKEIIEKNWNYIKNEIIKLNSNDKINRIALNIEQNNYNVNLVKINQNGEIINNLLISKDQSLAISHYIYKESRIITFKHFSGDKSETNRNLVCNPKDIGFYLKKYNIQFPKYKLNEESKSIGSKDEENIFKKEEVTEIYDAKNEFAYTYKDFIEYYLRVYKKVSDYYIHFGENNICNDINEGKYLISDKRKILEDKIKNFNLNNNSFLFLTGKRKIGKSLTILKTLHFSNFMYFDMEYLNKIDKKKQFNCIIKELIRLFIDYENYIQFIRDIYEKIIGLDNFLEFIHHFIKHIISLIHDQITIVIDNYDDFLVKKPIDLEYIKQLHRILLLNNKIKIIICGSGIFFNEMIYNYFKGYPIGYDFYYINNLDSLIDENLSKNSNEYLQYLLKKYNNNMNEVIFYIILFKKVTNPISGFDDFKIIKDFPSQFHEFINDKISNCTIIKFYNENYFRMLENEIKNNHLNDLIFYNLKYFNNNAFKGFVEEELIINLIEIGKIFDKKIPEQNIVIVDELIKIKNEKTNKIFDKSLPILIKQKNYQGESFDLFLVINQIALFIQIGINKSKEDINKIIEKNTDNILENLSKFLNIKLNSCEKVVFFEKEHQDKLKEEYNKIFKSFEEKENSLKKKYTSLNKPSNIMKNDTEYQDYLQEKKNLSYFSSTVGSEVCNILNIPYFLFSIKDFKLYFKEKLINSFENLLNYIEEVHKIPKNILEELKNVTFFNDITEGKFYEKIGKNLVEGIKNQKIKIDFDNFILSCNELSFNNFKVEYLKDKYQKISFRNGKIVQEDTLKDSEDYNNYYLIKFLGKKKEKTKNKLY